jgi:hypothetical protein
MEGHLDMTEGIGTKTIALSDAYKDLMQVVKVMANKEIKDMQYNIQAEVNYINFKVYGGYQYIKAVGDDGSLLQLIVPSEVAKTLQTKHYYEFSAHLRCPVLPNMDSSSYES